MSSMQEIFGGDDEVKDDVLSRLLPEKISECSLKSGDGGTCMSSGLVGELSKKYKVDKREVVDKLKTESGCNDEKCLVIELGRRGDINDKQRDGELLMNFKMSGPLDGTLLNNNNIDNILFQWSVWFPELFPFNFNMLDYEQKRFRKGRVEDKPDTLATVNFEDMAGKKCCACVINSDVYSGQGKHWMALFADWRGDERTVEFFNSSGRPPAPEWCMWLIKMQNQMGPNTKVIKATSIRHQKSKSECGLYSLFYIWARLNKVPASYFSTTPVPDRFMFEFRHHIYDSSESLRDGKFDWAAYKTGAKVKWE